MLQSSNFPCRSLREGLVTCTGLCVLRYIPRGTACIEKDSGRDGQCCPCLTFAGSCFDILSWYLDAAVACCLSAPNQYRFACRLKPQEARSWTLQRP